MGSFRKENRNEMRDKIEEKVIRKVVLKAIKEQPAGFFESTQLRLDSNCFLELNTLSYPSLDYLMQNLFASLFWLSALFPKQKRVNFWFNSQEMT